jgi:ribosomal protein S18 acetylase RimI-like enzyme
MAPSSFTPIRLEPSNLGRAAEVMRRAFADDPLLRYVLQDAAGPRRAAWLHARTTRYAMIYGDAHVTSEVDAVALWLHPRHAHLTFGRMLRLGLVAAPLVLGPAVFRRLIQVTSFMDDLRRQAVPEDHWYLLILAVDPRSQRQGRGSALIRHGLARADAEGLPCYLETGKEKNVAFYRRHGFEVAQSAQIPRGGPRLWTMIRQPRH